MDANEFWCRAFLAATGAAYADEQLRDKTHQAAAIYCGDAADAALAVAQRRGMVTGERTASAEPPQAAEPELERVEFTATSRGDMWELHGAELGSGIQVFAGRETYPMGGATVRIKWGETMPPKPIEVWIERR